MQIFKNKIWCHFVYTQTHTYIHTYNTIMTHRLTHPLCRYLKIKGHRDVIYNLWYFKIIIFLISWPKYVIIFGDLYEFHVPKHVNIFWYFDMFNGMLTPKRVFGTMSWIHILYTQREIMCLWRFLHTRTQNKIISYFAYM